MMFRQPSLMVVVAAVVAAASILFGPSHPTNSRASSSSLFVVCDAAFLIATTADSYRIHNTRNMSGSRSSSSILSSSSSSSSMNTAQTPKQKTFNYFAYGSNMFSSTMIELRQLQPIASTAAILPGYRLRFNVPGLPGIEPSWASVEPVPCVERCDEQPMELVHGVMHTLTAQDFATVCRTEGVPFSYVLQKCSVVPYIGDGKAAGQCKWESSVVASSTSTSSTITRSTMNYNPNWGVSAYTLLAGPVTSLGRREDDIPPSRSYMNVLLRGAKEFALDASYLRKLEQIQVGKTWIGDGLAEGMLQRAAMERRR